MQLYFIHGHLYYQRTALFHICCVLSYVFRPRFKVKIFRGEYNKYKVDNTNVYAGSTTYSPTYCPTYLPTRNTYYFPFVAISGILLICALRFFGHLLIVHDKDISRQMSATKFIFLHFVCTFTAQSSQKTSHVD